jgi:hypothetical protein
MELQDVLKKYANAVVEITPKFHSTHSSIIPVGNAGAIADHFLEYSLDKRMIPHKNNLANSVYMSSKNGIDETRLTHVVLDQSKIKKNHLYFLDERTQTGKLGEMIEARIANLEKNVGTITYDYAVLFDKEKMADISGSDEDFTDEERAILKWVDSPADLPVRFYPKLGIADYSDLSHDRLAMLRHVPQIKKLI